MASRRRQSETKTSFWVPQSTLRALKARAAEEGKTLRDVLLRAIEQYLKSRENRR